MSKPNFISGSEWQLVNSICNSNSQEPYLIAAIGWHETHWGLLGAGKLGFILGFGYYPGSTLLDKYRGLENQLKGADSMIRSNLNFPVTQNTLDDFAVNHWKSSAPLSWSKSVFSIFVNISQGIFPVQTDTEIKEIKDMVITVDGIDRKVTIRENAINLLKELFKKIGDEIGNEH